MHILTDAQRIFFILLMWADFVFAVGLHIWYRLKVVKKYDAVLLKSGFPHQSFDLMGGRIFLYMRAALSPAWFDKMHRKENLFDPKLLAPHVTRFDKILMLVQLVVIPLFFILLFIL